MGKRLFDPVVPLDRWNPTVALLRTYPGYEPARLAMETVFESFEDTDGNFVEQFQTTGFDARVFELFLHAYFTAAEFAMTRPKERPDFLLEKGGLTVAVEATTSNPTRARGATAPPSAVLPPGASIPDELVETADRPSDADALPESPSPEELAAARERVEHEFPIKIGSALYSKLQKRYWELPVVQGRPLVLAIEAFHADDSLYFSSAGIAYYLFGIRQTYDHGPDGALRITNEPREDHRLGEKVIPSNFFAQPGAEHVSAVLFTNSGTVAKFTRMGYQAGLHRGNLFVTRTGMWVDPDPNATEAREMSYHMHGAPFFEEWGYGVTVFHNPNALHPIPHDFFPDATQVYWEEGELRSHGSLFSPYISRTITLTFDNETYTPADAAPGGVGTILQSEFEELDPPRSPMLTELVREVTWFATKERSLLGVMFQDRIDETYHYVVLGRDLNGMFRAVELGAEFSDQRDANAALIEALEALRATGQTVFEQGDEDE